MIKKRNLNIYMIATEPSGDAIGSFLIESLKKKNKKIKIYGIGGQKMIKSGLKKSLFPIKKLSIFGVFEVIPKIFNIINLINKTYRDVIKLKPDILITIDSPDFNFRILKKIINKSSFIKKIHYVAPTVWAWREGRAKKLASYADKLLTILPFEDNYFKKYKLDSVFVGHPIYDINKNLKINKKKFYLKYKIKNNYKIISFLPGSRLNEIKRTLSFFIKKINLINNKFDLEIHVLFNILPHLKKYFYKYNIDFPHSIVDEKDKYKSFNFSNAAISASGTAAIELSYFKVPTIIVYKLNLLSYFVAKILVKIKFANLINIIENKYIIPEFLQFKCNPKLISKELLKLLSNKKYSQTQLINCKKALLKLKKNKNLPSENAAKEILNVIS